MKTLKIFLVCSLFFVSSVSKALCIGCGCSKAYKACVEAFENNDENIYRDNGDGTWTVLQTYAECKQSRRDCHGNGIRIELI